MTLEPLLAPFTEKGKQVSTRSFGMILELKTETGRAAGDQWGAVLQLVPLHRSYCIWPLEVFARSLQQMCGTENCVHGHGTWVSNRNDGITQEQKDRVLREKPGRSRRSVVDSEWSGLGGGRPGWRQEVSFTLEEIWELLREQNGHLKRIPQGLNRGSGAGSEEVEDSTIRE